MVIISLFEVIILNVFHHCIKFRVNPLFSLWVTLDKQDRHTSRQLYYALPLGSIKTTFASKQHVLDKAFLLWNFFHLELEETKSWKSFHLIPTQTFWGIPKTSECVYVEPSCLSQGPHKLPSLFGQVWILTWYIQQSCLFFVSSGHTVFSHHVFALSPVLKLEQDIKTGHILG